MHNFFETIQPFKQYIFKLNFEFDWEVLKPICEELIVGKDARSTSQRNFVKPHYHVKEFLSDDIINTYEKLVKHV